MNFNILGYAIYLLVTVFIIVRVGKICYENGNIFVAQLIPHHTDLCHKINHVLLVAYYLLNMGYCAATLIGWQQILTLEQLIAIIAFRTGIIVLFLSLMHYFNIYMITKYVQKLIQ